MLDGIVVGSVAGELGGSGRSETLWVVAGPCRAESEDRVLATARSIKHQVSAFSAGLWASGGVGSAGLPWLRRVRDELGLRTAVEVSSPSQVEDCLRHGIDIIGIDTRATGDASLIQELASALRGADVPVLVKNPTHPDVRSWLDSFELLSRAGVRSLVAVHQGFSTSDPSRYRCPPDWRVVSELRRQMPQLPVICDPSNIAGAGHLVPEVAQHAVEMNTAGLMIAISDGDEVLRHEHELTPDQLVRLLASLVASPPRTAAALIDELRQQIDVVDKSLLDALARRMALVTQIGRHKQSASIGTIQIDRWMKVLEHRLQIGRSLQLPEGFVLALFELIHQESIIVQNNLRQSSSEEGSES